MKNSLFSVITTKSAMQAIIAAVPAQSPATKDICGTTPESFAADCAMYA